MKSSQYVFISVIGILCVVAFVPNLVFALPINEAVESIADRLVNDQFKGGINPGTWPAEADFTGSIVAGMVDAYELTSENAYKDSAELGGNYILWSAWGTFFYGDEAYALTRLSEISDDPDDNLWRDAVSDFYWFVQTDPGGTEEYIDRFTVGIFTGTEPSNAVFYIAYNVVAAYYVDTYDKEIWRQALIDWLSLVDDDSSEYPVMALGVATWALAKTGPLDETLIDPSGEGAPYWDTKKLEDLPILLSTHQVPDGQPGEGSFYWKFQHNEGDPNNYTEDAIYATLGLVAASQVIPDPNLNLDPDITAAREALLNGIGSEGKVYERLSQEGALYYAYSGEMLQVLRALHILGDTNLDGQVNLTDLETLVLNWQASDCSQSSWCEGADIDQNGEVNADDLQILMDNWLKGQTD